jgi:hypothetical protein
MDLIYYFYRMTAGYNNFFKGLKWPVLLAVSLLANNVVAQVIVTPGTAASGSLCVGDDYVNVGDIEVVENVPNALGNGTFTYILTPPTNFEFDPASGSVSVLQGDQLSIESVTQWSTTFTIEYTHNDDGSTLDGFKIEGLKIKATGAGGPSLITANGGTSPARNGQDHGTFSSVQVVANAGDDVSICEGNSTVVGGTPAATGGDGNYTYLWTPTPELSDATAPNPTATPAASVTYTLTVTDGTGCSGVDEVEITVTAAATADAGPDAEVCGTEVFDITGRGSIGGSAGLAIWSTSGTGTFNNGGVLGLSTTYTPSAADIAVGTVVLTLTTDDPAGDCGIASDAMELTITAVPLSDLSGVTDLEMCSDASNYVVAGASSTNGVGILWSTGGDGSFIDNTVLNPTYVPGGTDRSSGSVDLTMTVLGGGSCGDVTDDISITVTAAATADAGPDAEVCGTEVFDITGRGSIGGSATSASWSTSGTGTFNNGGVLGLSTTYTPSAADIAVGTVVLTLTTDDPAGDCGIASDAMELTITAVPLSDLSGVTDLEMCSDASNYVVAGASSTNGVGILWSTGGDGSFVDNTVLNPTYVPGGTDRSSGSVDLTMTVLGGGSCGDVTDDISITVTPAATADAGPDAEVCGTEVFDITGRGSIGGSAGLAIWSTSGTGTFNNGGVLGLSTTYTPSAADIAVGTVVLTLTTDDPAGDCGIASDAMELTITAVPLSDLSGVTDLEMCSDASNYVVAGASSTNGVGILWSTGGDGSFVDNTVLNPTYVPGGTDRSSGSVDLTMTVLGGGSCGDVTDDISITVTAAATADAGPDAEVCGTEVFDITGRGSIGGSATSASWSTSGTGTFNNGGVLGLSTTYTPSAADIAVGTVVLTLTTDDPAGDCGIASDAMELTITAVPLSDLSGVTDLEMCSDASNYVVAGASSTNGVGILWSTGGDGSFVDNTVLNPTYVPGGTDRSSGSVDLTMTVLGGGSCGDVTDDISITVTPAATADAGPDAEVCGTEVFDITGRGSIGGSATSASWSTSGTGTFNNGGVLGLSTTYTPSAADIAVGTVVLTLTTDDPAGDCGIASDAMELTITAVPLSDLSGVTDLEMCSDASNYVVAGASSTNGVGILWSTGGDGSFVDNTVLNPTYVPGGTDRSSGSVDLTMTVLGGGSCGDVTDDISITVTPAATADAGPDAEVCGTEVFDITGRGSIGGSATSASWSTSGTGTFNNGGVLGLSTTYTPSAADIAVGTVVLTLTTDDPAGDCGIASDAMELTITAVPLSDLSGVTDLEMCSDASNYVVAGASSTNGVGILWSTGGDGSFVDNTVLNPTYVPGGTDRSSGSVDLTMTVLGGGSCGDVTDDISITVTPAATADAGPDAEVCGTEVFDITGRGSIGGSATSASWSTSGTGTFNNGGVLGLSTTYTPSAADIAVGTVVLTLATDDPAGDCGIASDAMELTITAVPLSDLSGVTDLEMCSDASNYVVAGASSTNGVGILWSTGGDGSFVDNTVLNPTYVPGGTDRSSGSVDLTMTVLGGGSCGDVTDDISITVTAAATADAGPDAEVCGTEVFDITGRGSIGGSATSASWSTSGTGTFNNGGVLGLSTTYTPSAADIAVGTVVLTLATDDPAGDCGIASDAMELTITAVPLSDLSGVTDLEMCSDASNYVVAGASSTNGVGILWSTGGDGSFVDNTVLNPTYVPGGTDRSSGSVDLTMTVLGGGSCGDVTDDISITVTPAATADAGPDAEVCGTEVFDITGRGSIGGSAGLAIWSTSGTGTFNNGGVLGLSTTYTPSAADIAVGTVVLTLTTDDPAGDCGIASDAMELTITAVPLSDLSGVTDLEMCSDASNYVVAGASSTNGVGILWSTGGDGSFVDNTVLNPTYVPGGTDRSSGSVDLTMTVLGGGSCGDVTDDISITVTAAATADAGPDAEVCGTEVFDITGRGSIGGSATSASWSTSGTGTFNNGGVLGLSTTYTPSAADIAVGTVVLTLTTDDPAGDCGIASDAMELTITAVPLSDLSGVTDLEMCSDASNYVVAGASSTNGVGILWSTGGDGSFVDNTVLNPTYVPGGTDRSSGSVDLTMTVLGGGSCGDVTDDISITVTPAATADAGPDAEVCGTEVFDITGRGSIGGSATSASWSTSGTGTFNNGGVLGLSTTYTPSAADIAVGTVVLTLTTDDPAGDCGIASDAMELTITAVPLSDLSGVTDLEMCSDASNYVVAGASSTNGVGILWSTGGDGSFVDNTVLNPTYVPGGTDRSSGSVDLTMTVLGGGSCGDVTDDISITVTPAATADAGPDAEVCGTEVFDITGRGSIGGSATSASWSTSGTGTFNNGGVLGLSTTYTPSAADIAVGTVVLTLTTDDPAGDCGIASDAMELTITAVPLSDLSGVTDLEMCSDASNYVVAGASSTNGVGILWSTGGDGSFVDNTVLNPTYVPGGTDRSSGSVDLTMTVLGGGSCGDVTDDISITVTPAATADAGPDAEVCGTEVFDITGRGSIGGSAGLAIWSTSGTGTFNNGGVLGLSTTYTPSAADIAVGTVVLTLATDDPAGDCGIASDAMELTITAVPLSDLSGVTDLEMCSDASNYVVAGASSTNGVGILWSTGGDGSFIDNTVLNPTYVPGGTDRSSGSVDLTMTVLGGGSCGDVTDDISITVTPAATADAGPDAEVCGTEVFDITGRGSIGGSATSASWSTSGTGTFNNGGVLGLSTTYTPSAADIAVGTVVLTLATDDPAGDCGIASDAMELTITAVPLSDLSGVTDLEMCSDASNYVVAGASSTNGVGILWSTGGDGSFVDNTVLNPTYVPGGTDRSSGSVDLTMTVLGGGSCGDVTDDISITVTAAATADAGPDAEVCGTEVFDITGRGSIGGSAGLAIWSTSGTGTFNNGGVLGLSTTYTPSAADIAVGTVVLTLTTDDPAGDCGIASDAMELTTTAVPLSDLSGVTDLEMCSDASNYVVAGASSTNGVGILWSTGGDGSFVDNTVLNPTYVPGGTDRSSGSVDLTMTVLGGGSCGDVTDDISITVTPAATADAGPDAEVCGTEVFDITGRGSIGGSATSASWSTSGTGTFNNGGVLGLSTTYTPSAADIAVGTVVLTLTTDDPAGDCGIASDAMELTITAVPLSDLSGVTDLEMCSDASNYVVAGASSTNGVGILWSTGGDGSFVDNTVLNPTYVPGGTDRSSGSVDLTMTVLGGGSCGDVTDDISITVTPAATADAGPDAEVCGTEVFDITGRGSIGGSATSASWSTSGTGTFNNGGVLGLSTTYTPSAADIAVGTVVLTLATDDPAGDCGIASDAMELTITAVPLSDLSGVTDLEMCSDASNYVVAGASSTNGVGILWSTGGDGSFVDNTVLNPTYVPGGTDRSSGSVDLTMTVLGGGSCGDVTDDISITVTPAATADAGPDAEVCGTEVFDITGRGSIGGSATSASWSTSGTGTFNNGGVLGLSTTYTPSAADIAVGTVVLTLTTDDPAGDCGIASDAMELTITAVPLSDLSGVTDLEMCSDASNYVVAGASSTNGVGILWSTDGDGSFIDNTVLNPTYVPGGTDRSSGSVDLTMTVLGGGSCGDVTDDISITVTPASVVDAGSNEEICEVTDVEQVFDFSLRSTQASSSNDNGTYNWVADPVVSGSFNDNTILNPTFEIVPGYNGTITFTLTAGGEGSCGDGVDSFVLLVRPTPSFSVTSHISNPTTINSGELTDIQISTTSGFVKLIQVIKSDNGLTGNSPINTLYQDGFTIQDVLENSTDIQQDIQYIFEAFDGSCTNPDKDTARVYVNPAPEFEVINTRPILCPSELTDITVDSETSGAVITLLDSIVSPNPNGITGMTPTGTSWSAVTSGLPFNITDGLVNSTDTIQTVRYIFEVNASGLTATKFTEVAVNPIPDFQLTLNDPFDSINSGTSTLILINTTTQNGVVVLDSIRKTGNILGNTTPGVTFVDGDQITDNLTNGTNSPQTITYYFSARANGCINAIDIDSAKVVVIPAPELVITNNQPEVCPINKTDIDLYSPTADAEVELTNITIIPDATGVSNFSPIGTIWAGGPTELVAKIADSLINSSDVIQTITYDLRISANGFTATTNKTVSVEIRPNPQMSLSNNNPNILSNTSTDIFINTPTENGQVELSAIDKDEDILGNTSAGVAFTDGNRINDVLVNNSDTILSISYIFRATANTCINPDTDTVSVTVNPIPNFTITNALPILCPEQKSDFEVTSPTANAEISLTAVQIAPNPSGVTGFTTPTTWMGDGSGLVLRFEDDLENLTDTIQTVTYEFDIEANGFAGTETKTVSVEVNPLPRQVITNNQPVVNVDTKTDILINTTTENGGALLSKVIKDAGIVGNTTSGVVFSDSDRIEDELVNQTDNVLTIKYVFNATANGCENSETDMAIVEVNPNPRLTIANNKPIICSGETVDIQINSPTAGATIRLVSATAVPDAGSVVGLTPDNFTWNTFPATISDELSQTTNVIQRVEYLFEVSVPGYANPVRQSAVVDVKPLPDISASGPEICSGGVTSVDIGNPNSVSFTVFNWTVSDANGNIEGEAPGTGNRITQVLDNTTVLLDSVIYRIYATAQLCAGDSIDVVQRVYPQNVAIAGTDTVVCQGTPAITIETANIAGGSTAASWSKITGDGTLTDETTLTPTYAPDPIDEVGTITLELTASNASVCPPVTDLVSIIINSKPTVEAGSDQTICEGSTALMSEAMIGGSAASVTWSDPSGKGSFLPNNATLNAIFEPHPDQVGTNVKLYVETNDPSGPCVSAIDSLYITINDAPEVFAGADQTICEGDVAVMSDATYGGGTSSVTWSGGAGTWDDVHKLDATYTPDASEIGEVVILTITTDDPDGPCTAISDQIRVAVNKAPEVYAGTDQIVCEGETVLIGDATSGGSTTSVLWTGGTGTFSPNNTTLNTTYIHAAGEVNSTVTLTITTNDPDGPCVAVSDQIDITINDAPEVFAGADQTICEGDVAVMSDATYGGGTSSITWSGGAGTWDDVHKLDATYTPDASEIGSVVILTITTDDPDGPCTAISDQIRVAVNKAPEVFAGVDKVICEGDQVLINDATSGGSTTSVLWTGGTGTFSPNNTTLNTTYIHAAGEVNSTVTLTITTNDPDGPCVAVSDQIDITINDAPEVFAGADQTICEGDVAVMSDATYGGGTSSITWSGGAGTWDDVHKLDATYTPDASEIGSVVILTITTDDPDGPCTAISDQIRVAVNKAPEVFAGVDKVICEGDQVLINDATSGGSTTSVLWTGGTGTFSPNNTTLNTTYIHAAGEVNSTVTLTITTNDPDGPCVAVSDQIDITINDAPEVFAGADQTICEGDVAVMSDATYGGGTSSVTWSGGAGTWDDVHKLDATYTPDASEIGSVVILTITTDDPDGPCAAISDQIRVAVNKAPEVFAGVDKVICEGDQVLINDATSGGSTTSVLWTGGTGTFSPNNTTLNTTYSHAAGEVNSTVTLTITTNDPDGPCVAVTDEVNITIDEAPTVDAGVYAPVCIGDAVQLNGLLGGSASSATWTGGVGEFDPDRNSTNARYIADESEQGGRVLLTLTTNDPDGVCVASSATTEIVVNRLPSPKIFFLKDAYQIDDAPETLVGEPSPGIFDGPGMFESTFIPAVADIGVHTITYTHTDGNGCTNFVSQETEVFPLPESEVGNPDPYCLGVNPTDFPLPRTSNTDELEDSWFGDNVFQAGDDYYFNNVAAGVGLHAIDYIVVNRSTGARDTLPRSATVYDVAKVNFTNINKCIADSIQFVDLSVLEDADVFGDEIESWIWEFGKGSNLRVSEEQNPKILFDENEPDNYFVKLEVVTKLGQCASDFAKDTIKVGAIPDADFFVSNLTSGELAQFSDATGVPNPRYISGSFIDPTTSIDSIWWDFGEPPAQFGAHQIYKNVEHRFSEPKEYNVKMVVKTNLGCRDTVTRSISILQVISTFPHITDFDTPPINDQAHRPDTSSWRLMVPDGNIIKGTSRAWVTSDEVTGRHKDSEHSFVALDAYDLRSLVRPMFTMDVWSNAESTRDGAMLQYSFNGNQWFTMIDEQAVEKVDYPAGQIGLNWYNEKGLVSRPGDGTIEGISGVGENEFAAGWTGIYDSWRTARFPLDDIRTELIEDNHISVRFRVVFASDEQNPEGTDYDGFAFDNIIVSDRSHNVLIEHFDNLSSGNQINLMNETAERFSLDMIALQYHTNYPQADVIYLNSKFPVETRGSIYDISQSPRAFMDGISEYNFTSATIEKYQIVNRSMIDPVFDIQLTPEKIAPNTVTMDVIITAQTAFDEEVTLYTMPIETSITRLDELNDFNIDSLNNIVKDLLPSGGLLIDQRWEVNDTHSTQLVWDLNQLNEGNEIYDTTKLGVIVFVQNAANEGSREIYQAIFEKLPVIQPTPITGLDDDLNARRIAEAEIYPNPADQHFNVALSGKLTSDVAWVIVDQRGIELQNGVFDEGEDLYQVDAAALPAGLHMMILSSSEDHRVIRKIIINR